MKLFDHLFRIVLGIHPVKPEVVGDQIRPVRPNANELIKMNYVRALAQFCGQKFVVRKCCYPKIFQLISDDGPAHVPNNNMECKVIVYKFSNIDK